MAPSAAQSVVTGSTMVMVESESGVTFISHLTLPVGLQPAHTGDLASGHREGMVHQGVVAEFALRFLAEAWLEGEYAAPVVRCRRVLDAGLERVAGFGSGGLVRDLASNEGVC